LRTAGHGGAGARVVHAYPQVLKFPSRHGPEALAVLDDLVARAEFFDGQLVVAARVRQLADRLGFGSRDTVHRRLRQLLSAGVPTRLDSHPADRFAVPVDVLHLDTTGVSRDATFPSLPA